MRRISQERRIRVKPNAEGSRSGSLHIRLIVRFFARHVRGDRYSVLPTEESARFEHRRGLNARSAWGRDCGVLGAGWGRLRHHHHRRRRQRLRNREGRRWTRLVRLSLRKRRSRLFDLQRLEQAEFTAACAIWSISSFVWFARRSSSGKFCGESRPISYGRFALCCPTMRTSDRRGCFELAFLFTTISAGASYCRQRGPCD